MVRFVAWRACVLRPARVLLLAGRAGQRLADSQTSSALCLALPLSVKADDVDGRAIGKTVAAEVFAHVQKLLENDDDGARRGYCSGGYDKPTPLDFHGFAKKSPPFGVKDVKDKINRIRAGLAYQPIDRPYH